MISIVTAISMIGFVAVYSAAASYGDSNSYFARQVLWFVVGLGIAALVTLIDYRKILSLSGWFHLGVILLLVATLLYGTGGPGSKVERWLKVGPFFIQPSEFVKYSLALALAQYFRDSRRIGDLGINDLFWPLAMTLLPFVLILKQPDLGTAGILFFVFTPIVFLVGLRPRVMALIAGLGVVCAPLAWFFVLKPYQKNRLLTLVDPESDPLGKGYHIIQSKIAVGSGGIWGKGFMKGTQAQLDFLPARHTDFIFSVFTEEWGFVGGIALLTLYTLLILWCLRFVGKTKDRSGTVLTLGVTSIIASHVLINMAMVVGIAPVVGMPLPFVSYGGSAMISNMVGIGLLLNVRMRRFQK